MKSEEPMARRRFLQTTAMAGGGSLVTGCASPGKHGRGWVYAVNTALDETGATVGPLLIALALYLKADFRMGYGLLLISSLLAVASLVLARIFFPVPSRLEAGGPSTAPAKGFTRSYWLYMAAGTFFAAGLMSFELVSYHLSRWKQNECG